MGNDTAKTTETTEVFRTGNHMLDEATFYEVKQYLYPIFKQRIIMVISIIAIIAGLIFFFNDKLIVGILLIVFGILVLLDALVARGRAVRKAIKQIRQITGKDHCTYTYTFGGDNLQVRCVETNMTEKIPYEDLVRRTETQNTIVLFTKNSRLIVFRKNALAENKIKQMYQVLGEKCPHMEFVPHKGYTPKEK